MKIEIGKKYKLNAKEGSSYAPCYDIIKINGQVVVVSFIYHDGDIAITDSNGGGHVCEKEDLEAIVDVMDYFKFTCKDEGHSVLYTAVKINENIYAVLWNERDEHLPYTTIDYKTEEVEMYLSNKSWTIV